MRRTALMSLALLALLAFACEDQPVESEEPAELLIAYNVLVDDEADDYDVFTMGLDGSDPRNVTNHPAVDWAYVADGTRLYMVSDRDEEKRKYHVYELTLGGGSLRQITAFRVRDSWMGVRNGGAELVVASSKDGTADLYLIDAVGNELRRLTDDDVVDNDATFSPDGGRVVWRSRRSGLDELWVMDLATGETRQLTQYPQDDPGREGHGYHAGPPVWESRRDIVSFCSKREGKDSIFSVRPDGTDLQRVAADDTTACWHDWSPDGRYLVYDGADDSGNYDIYLLDTDTGETVRLTSDPRYEQAPVFVEAPATR